MKLKEIKEAGFYKVVGDEDLWEAFENTDEDKGWVDMYPLLLDSWIYDHTDQDERKHYKVDGLLYRIGYDFPDLEVEKVDQEYEIYGNAGTSLVEKKPTFKERYYNTKKAFDEWKEVSRATGICETCTAVALSDNDDLRKEVKRLKELVNKQKKEISALKSTVNNVREVLRELHY